MIAARSRRLPRTCELSVLGGIMLLDGCAALPAAVRSPNSSSNYCSPPGEQPPPWTEDTAPPQASRVERVAALLGISEELRQVQTVPAAQALEASVIMLERLELARTAIEATVAELDCEGERAEQLAAFLDRQEESSTLRFTVSSIVVGAATGIASAFLQGENVEAPVQEAVAVVGGVATAGLALVPLFRQPEIEFSHPRNLLADVWFGPDVPSTFPDVVWAYLSRPEYSNQQVEPIRMRLIARWRQYQAIQPDSPVTRLVFGSGGRYDSDTLHLRADMLDQVKAEVRLMNQDLADLARALNRGSLSSNWPVAPGTPGGPIEAIHPQDRVVRALSRSADLRPGHPGV